MKITFIFVAATVITIFAAGSVLMSVISTGVQPISQEMSDTAADFSSTFLTATILFVVLAIIVSLLLGGRRVPF